MLAKLLKYEFKSTGRMFGVIYAVILILSLVMGLLGRGIFQDAFGISEITWDQMMDRRAGALVIVMLIYMIMIVAMVIFTLVVILERFYRNLLKGEGYLMHTLPVPTWMLVASKTISAVVWNVLGVFVVLFSFVLILLSGGVMVPVLTELSEITVSFSEIFGTFSINLWEFIGIFVLESVFCVLLVYASMAIGGSAKRHKKRFSVLTFIVILIVIAIIGMVFDRTGQVIRGFQSMSAITVHGPFDGYFATPAAWLPDVIYSAVFFVLTTVFLQKRLNLE